MDTLVYLRRDGKENVADTSNSIMRGRSRRSSQIIYIDFFLSVGVVLYSIKAYMKNNVPFYDKSKFTQQAPEIKVRVENWCHVEGGERLIPGLPELSSSSFHCDWDVGLGGSSDTPTV